MSVVTDVDIEAWLDGELDLPCDLQLGSPENDVPPCWRSAEWLIVGEPTCDCGARRSTLVCSFHKDQFTAIGGRCGGCRKHVNITYVERVRNP